MRFAVRLVLVLLILASAPCFAKTWRITLLEWAENPELDRSRVERAYMGHPQGSLRDAIALAIEDAQIELSSANHTVSIDSVAVSDEKSAALQAARAEKSGAHFIFTDVPASWLAPVALSVKIPVINLSSQADALREQSCQKNLLHSMPSERMHTDALAQSLMMRKWKNVLLFSGSSDLDKLRSAAALSAIKRYGLALVSHKSFKMSNDPRERNLANPLLLSAGLTYDAIWVVDSDGEFARALPYNTSLPRPVVGDAGMMAMAWHPQFERYGGPQLSKRFFKLAKRSMTPQDWAAWVAAKSITTWAAQAQANATTSAAQLSAMAIDGYKGVVLQFRSWDRQLRQPMLLTDGQSIIDVAPSSGILHPKNALDTLGADEPEKLCPHKS